MKVSKVHYLVQVCIQMSEMVDVKISLSDGEQRTYEKCTDFIRYEDSFEFVWEGWTFSFHYMNVEMLATKPSEVETTSTLMLVQ